MKKARIAKRSQKRPKSRSRLQKAKGKQVLSIGEQPDGRVVKKGKVRQFDLPGKHKTDDHIPRKTRDFMAAMTHWKLNPNASKPKSDESSAKEAPMVTNETSTRMASEQKIRAATETMDSTKQPFRADTPHLNTNAGEAQQASNIHTSGKRFDGMKSGESLSEYSARLRKESQRMAIDIAKKGNHQAEKRKAYNKRRHERLARRKRRRRGECSDSDVEDDKANGEDTPSISHLPSYWQEIVRNNGRPVSTKKKKRMLRMERETLKHKFGDQVDCPPNLTVHPVRRSSNFAIESA